MVKTNPRNMINPKSRRLTLDEINQICELSKRGWKPVDIAHKFKVSRNTISRVYKSKETTINAYIPPEIAKIQSDIVRLKSEGWSYAQIATEFGKSRKSRSIIYSCIKNYEEHNFAS